MEAALVTREEARILGVLARIEPAGADYGQIWRERFTARETEIAARAAQPGYFGVYFGTEVPGQVDFVAGMMAKDDAPAAEGLVLRPVPGGRYAKFVATLAGLGPVWGRIYGEWLPRSAFEEDVSRPCLEYFRPESDADSPVEIYLPVRPRA